MKMFDFEDEKAKEFSAVGFKNQRLNLRVLKQRGTSNKKRDAAREALAPGKRISKNGKIYWESRKNRTDKVGSNL